MRCHECGVLMVGIGTALACPCCNDLRDAIQPDPTIPLTQVKAMLREAWNHGYNMGLNPYTKPSDVWPFLRRDEWIANKIKEARQ